MYSVVTEQVLGDAKPGQEHVESLHDPRVHLRHDDDHDGHDDPQVHLRHDDDPLRGVRQELGGLVPHRRLRTVARVAVILGDDLEVVPRVFTLLEYGRSAERRRWRTGGD